MKLFDIRFPQSFGELERVFQDNGKSGFDFLGFEVRARPMRVYAFRELDNQIVKNNLKGIQIGVSINFLHSILLVVAI